MVSATGLSIEAGFNGVERRNESQTFERVHLLLIHSKFSGLEADGADGSGGSVRPLREGRGLKAMGESLCPTPDC